MVRISEQFRTILDVSLMTKIICLGSNLSNNTLIRVIVLVGQCWLCHGGCDCLL